MQTRKTVGKYVRMGIIVFCLIFVPVGRLMHAYDIEWGVMAGRIHSKSLISQSVPGMSYGPVKDWTWGVQAAYFLISDWLGIQAEFQLTQKGFKALEYSGDQEIISRYKISYFEIPVLVSFNLPLKGRIKPGLVLGPYIGFARKAKEVQTAFGETRERMIEDNLLKTDLGWVIGSHLRFELNRFVFLISVRYNHGLVNISNDIRAASPEFDEHDYIKNRALFLLFGIHFN